MSETTADPVEQLGAMLRSTSEAIASLATSQAALVASQETVVTELRGIGERLRPVETETEPERDPGLLPGARVDPSDTMRDAYTREGYTRADFELAMMIAGGARELRQGPVDVNYSEEFTRAARYHIFEDPKNPAPRVLGGNGRTRAMDTAETGFGLELIGTQYVSDLWEAARNLDTLVNDIRSIPMAAPSVVVPINGEIPEMLFVGENTDSTVGTKYGTSKTPSNKATLTAKKFTIQQLWSGELGEDSIIPFVPFLRDMLSISAAQHLGSAYLNGDTTNAGTGNINSDDADPTDTKHYLAFDGIRHDWLVTTTTQGIDQAAALALSNINVARGRLSGVDDDIDAAVKTINWGRNARELRLVCDWTTYLALLGNDEVVTVDKYANNATIVTGELASIYGIPIISPSYASKTEADGKASGTESSNTKGQITIFAPRAYLGGVRREVQFFMDRVQGRDQFLIELYTRRAFTRFGTTGAAGIYNITV